MLNIDAKYKEILNEEGKLCVSPEDVYQMLAYSVGYACNNIVIAYPKMLNGLDGFELGQVEIPKGDASLSLKIIQVDLLEQPKDMSKRLAEYLSFFISRA